MKRFIAHCFMKVLAKDYSIGHFNAKPSVYSPEPSLDFYNTM